MTSQATPPQSGQTAAIVRVLYLEDRSPGAASVMSLLEASRTPPLFIRSVASKTDFLSALRQEPWHVVLYDAQSAALSDQETLELTRSVHSRVPVIILTDDPGEERAVEMLKAGAADYVLKGQLNRLIPAVVRACTESEKFTRANELLSGIIDNTPDMIAAVNPTFHYIALNEAYRRECREIFGADFRVGMSMLDLLDSFPADRENAKEVFGRALQGETFAVTEEYGRLESRRTYELRFSPIRDTQGNIIGAAQVGRDMTERRRAEEALRESERLYRILFANTQDAFQLLQLFFDEEGNVCDWQFQQVNESFELQTGLKASSVLGKRAREILPEIEQYWMAALGKVAKTGIAEHIENYNQDTRRWYDDYIFPYGDGLVGILFRDITERKHAEKAIRESEQRYYTLFEDAEDAFQIVEPLYDESHRVLDVRYMKINRVFEQHFGVRASQVVGRTANEILPALEKPWFDMFGKVVESGKQIRCELFSEITARWYDLLCFPHAEGQVGVLLRDITRRKQVEDRLKYTNRKISEILDSIQDDFYVLDRNWVFVYACRLFTGKIGKEPKDFVGNNIWEMFPKHLGTLYEENLRAAMEHREVRRFEIPGKYTNSWYRMTVYPSEEGVTVLGTDITEQRKADAALRASDENLRLMVSQASDAMMVVNAEGVIEAVSGLGMRLLGYEEGELVGKSVGEFAETLSRLQSLLTIEELRRQAPRPVSVSMRIKTKMSGLQWMSVTASLVNMGTDIEKYFISFQRLGVPSEWKSVPRGVTNEGKPSR